MNIAQLIETSQNFYPENKAIIYQNQTFTYKEINQLANQVASGLKQSGIHQGDRVALCLPNMPAFLISLLGIQKIGAISVAINPGYRSDEINFILEDSGASGIIITQECLKNIVITPRVKHIFVSDDSEKTIQFKDLRIESNCNVTAVPMNNEDPSVMLYTSGTTGNPKGAILTHGNLIFTARSCAYTFRTRPEDKILLCLPMYHSFAQTTVLFQGLFACATIILLPEFETNSVLSNIEFYKATKFFGVPTMYKQLITKASQKQLHSINAFFSSAAPLSESLEKQWSEKFGKPVLEIYGTTETSMLTFNHYIKHQPGSAGAPPEGIAIKIIDDSGENVDSDSVGEIAVQGKNVMSGYWNLAHETAQSIRSGWFFTGDMGKIDHNGYLIITDRKKDMINVGGFKVYPSEVEQVISRHPAVSDVAVYSAFDDLMGEQVIASIVLSSGHSCDETQIHEYASRSLASYKVPGVIQFVEALPRGKTGKVLKRVLREQHSKQSQITNTTLSKKFEPNHIEKTIKQCLTVQLPEVKNFRGNRTFTDMGMDSIIAMTTIQKLNDKLGIYLKTSDIFNHATINQLTKHIVSMSGNTPVKTNDIVDHTKTSNIIPLSSGQQALWYIYKLAPESPSYNASLSIRILDKLNIMALKKSFQHQILQHECLRTLFTEKNGIVHQHIQTNQDIDFIVVDVCQDSPETISAQIKSAQQQPFNLETGPLMRLRLFKESDTNYILLMTIHHIIFDGWSLWNMIESINVLYKSFANGEMPGRIPCNKTYADFVRWQKEMCSGKQRKQHQAYWLSKLKNITSVINLPTDHPYPPVQEFQGDAVSFALSETLSQGIIALSKELNTSVYTILLSAYQTLLYRYTNQEDILIGSPMSGRTNAHFNNVFGYFVNTVVLRGHFTDDLQFTDLLETTRKTVLEAIDHQDYPFPLLIEDLKIERDASRSPLIQVKFFYQQQQTRSSQDYISLLSPDPTVKPQIKLADLCVEAYPMAQQEGQFDLSLEMIDINGQLVGMFDYNTALFEKNTIQRAIDHFKILLDAIVKNPSHPISQFPLLTPCEKNQLLVTWNNTHVDYPKDICMHHLFEAQVEKTPNAIAVTFENMNLTYLDLEKRANALAHYLQSLGVCTETLVGICMERSLEMIVGLMGILKSGGAYVPIDPGYPKDRVDFMRKDARVKVIITQKKFESLISDHTTKLIYLDTLTNLSENEPPVSDVCPSNAMYVLYTSGSTGKPKGAINTHVALINRLLWMQDAYQLSSKDNVLQKTPFSFDVSGWEFFWPLITGARLVFARPEGHKDPNYLIQLIKKEKITTLHFVPPMLQSFLKAEDVASCDSLRHVICSGEALPYELQKEFFKKLNANLHNLYGPTEAAIDVTYWECHKDSSLTIVPIGKPIANTQMYVLDRQLRPVPIGVPGELHIGGIQVARGYLNRPELTREKFIKDPFSADSNAQLYKTGDLARYMPDGNIEFLGRLDHQIKIRGLRIELGEIESCLQEHHLVGEIVIRLHEDSSGKRLVAYATRTNAELNDDLRTNELKSFLKTKLPDYMVPAIFMWMDQLPLSPNGKIDRKALPKPVIHRLNRHTPPKTQIEKQLTQIWSELLQFDEPIGIHDNFYDIGGDSIISLQIVARAKEFGLRINNNDILQYQTIAELATVVKPIGQNEKILENLHGHFALTPVQKAFFTKPLINPNDYSQYVYFQLPSHIQADILEQAFAEIIAHHDSLKLVFYKVKDKWVQSYSQLTQTPFDVIRLIDGSDQHIQDIIQSLVSDIQAQFDLTNGPLIKMEIIQWGHENWLLCCAHHLIIDGISWRILMKDLTIAYDQIQNNEQIQLPEKTDSFKRWASHLNEYARHSSVIEEVPFWKKSEQKSAFPVDFPDCDNTYKSVDYLEIELNTSQTARLINQANRIYQTTVEELMLTALTQTLCEWIGQMSCVIDLESHGRSHMFESIDLSETLGWFTNIFPVSFHISSPGNIELSIKEIKQQLRSVPNKGMGYGLLKHIVEHKALENMTSSPVLFNYLGQFDQKTSENLFAFSQNSIGLAQNHMKARDVYIEIVAWIVNNRLHCQWYFSKNCHQHARIENLSNSFQKSLCQIIDHCCHAYHTQQEQPEALLMPLQSTNSNLPLFCVPGLQGDPKYFQAFAYQLKNHFAVYGLCTPELSGQASQNNLESLARLYIGAIKTIQPQGPYHLAGHSFGALIAFEIACQLEQNNESIASISIFDQPAPQVKQVSVSNADINLDAQLLNYIKWLEMSNNIKTDISLTTMKASTDIFDHASKQLEQAGLSVNKERLKRLMMAFTNNMSLFKRYVSDRRLKARLTVVQAESQTNLDKVSPMFSDQKNFQMWENHSQQPIRFLSATGTHFNMFAMPYVKTLSKNFIHSIADHSDQHEIEMSKRMIIDPVIEKYAMKQIDDEPEYLKALAQKTRMEMKYSFMMSSAIEGRFLKLLVQIFQPRCIFEIGTFTGYSTLSMAEGLSEKGKIITCDISEHALSIAKHAFDHSPHAKKITIKKGPALKTLNALDYDFDFAFIDADKQTYPEYYEAVVRKIQPGGLIVVDNVLFFGRVIDPDGNDPDAKAIDRLNSIIKNDDRVDNVLLTVRDGIQLIRKK